MIHFESFVNALVQHRRHSITHPVLARLDSHAHIVFRNRFGGTAECMEVVRHANKLEVEDREWDRGVEVCLLGVDGGGSKDSAAAARRPVVYS